MRVFSFLLMASLFAGSEQATAQNLKPASWIRKNASGLRQGESVAEESNPGGNWLEESRLEIDCPEVEDPFEEPIETDRHDFTQSPKVIGRGVRQLEYGFFYSTLSDGTERETTYAAPELLFRFGLNERIEFRTRYNYGWKYDKQGEDIRGNEDLIFGIKYQLSEQCSRRPETAVEFRLSAPTGDDDVSSGRWEPGIDYIYGWKFGNRYSLTGSTGGNANALGDIAFITVDTDPGDHFIAWTQSVAWGAQLTRKSTGYFEWYGIFTHGREEESTLSFLNLGLDYLINKNVVVDFRIGWGLTEVSDDVFAGIGGAFRF